MATVDPNIKYNDEGKVDLDQVIEDHYESLAKLQALKEEPQLDEEKVREKIRKSIQTGDTKGKPDEMSKLLYNIHKALNLKNCESYQDNNGNPRCKYKKISVAPRICMNCKRFQI